MASLDDAWDINVDEPESTSSGPCNSFVVFLRDLGHSAWLICKTASMHPVILITTAATFGILCVAGLTSVLVLANRVQAALHVDAVHNAEDADMALSTELSKALFPLFAMDELVKHLHVFDDLPQRIGGTSNVTIEHGVVFQNASNFRNVSGICDDPRYTKPYNRIASSVKSNANLSKVLLNIQLASRCSLPHISPDKFRGLGQWGHTG